ncbi:MAG TPA: hypothetical protein DDZ22_19480 [Massilia sp.]|nr:hypothetical protein [Massilia sp.]
MDKGRIQHIDVWRFIAITMVVVSHLVRFLDPWYQHAFPDILSAIRKSGPLGVQLFFCISGYVICRGMMREAAASGTVSMRGFYIRRAYRILPPLAVYLLCIAVLNHFGVFDLGIVQFLKVAAFLCNFRELGPSCPWEIGHTWSLAYEEQFYLIFPLLFLVGRYVRTANAALKTAVLAAPLVVLALVWKNSAITTYLGFMLFMLAGCLFALYWEKLGPLLARLPLLGWLAIVLLVLAIGLLPQPLALRRLLAFVLPVLICIIVFGTPVHRAGIRSLFTNGRLAHVGRISYGIYLWQQLATANHGFSSPFMMALALSVLTVVLAHYSYRFFELPLIKRGNARAARHAAPTTTPEEGREYVDDAPVKMAA